MLGSRLLEITKRAYADLIFPPRCTCCDAEISAKNGPMLCEACFRELAPEPPLRCLRCAARIPGPIAEEDGCVLCRNAGLHFDRVATLGSYDGSLRSATLRMKHSEQEPLTMSVAELLWDRTAATLKSWDIDVVVPIPMHWSRRVLRATNSPDLLAATLARQLNVTLSTSLVVRRRNTATQSRLPPGRRFENVRGAFRLRRGVQIRGARLLLVDDILTTGATCSEVARVCKRAGAAAVEIAVVARAQGHH
jgi:ComF family protein